MDIRPLSVSQEKWRLRAQAATPAYEDGVKDPKVRWAGPASDAKGAWADGVQKAIASDAFSRGVEKAGDAKWQNAAIRKGVPRFGQGIRESGDNYSKGFGPYHSALAALILPPRYARRDERNVARFEAVRTEMIRVKESEG